MNTNLQGNIGEAKALQYFIENEYEVYLPFGTASKCDMIIVKDGKVERVSVKTCSGLTRGRYMVRIRQGKLNQQIPFDKSSSDILFVYVIPLDKIFTFNSKDIKNGFELTLK